MTLEGVKKNVKNGVEEVVKISLILNHAELGGGRDYASGALVLIILSLCGSFPCDITSHYYYYYVLDECDQGWQLNPYHQPDPNPPLLALEVVETIECSLRDSVRRRISSICFMMMGRSSMWL
jgi:hypothetical protein